MDSNIIYERILGSFFMNKFKRKALSICLCSAILLYQSMSPILKFNSFGYTYATASNATPSNAEKIENIENIENIKIETPSNAEKESEIISTSSNAELKICVECGMINEHLNGCDLFLEEIKNELLNDVLIENSLFNIYEKLNEADFKVTNATFS